MFGIGGFELLIILIFGFILVGDRLPDVAKTLGRALKTFRSAQQDMSKIIREDVFDPNADEPFKDPLAALDKMGDVAKKTGSSLASDFDEMKTAAAKKQAKVAAAPAGAEAPEGETVVEAAPAQAEPAATEAPAETFAQRRERYQRERAARLAAEAEAAKAAEEAAAEAPVASEAGEEE